MSKKEDVKETGRAGIKHRISDGKYIVSLDLGRQMRVDRKTGERKLKQVKTTKVVNTLKEAKALLGENNKEKWYNKITNTTGKTFIENVIKDYDEKYFDSWSESYKQQKKTQEKHFINYFKDVDLKKVDTNDIEDYFFYCREENGLSNNTINKHKCHLQDIWKFMKKGKTKYGIRENVVIDADYGKIEKYKPTALSIIQLNTLIEQCLLEQDKSVLLMVGLPALAGLRRSELCGLKYKDIDFENKSIFVGNARVQVNTGYVEKLPKGEKTRNTCICLPLEKCIKLAMEEQDEWLQNRKLTMEDYVYKTRTNILNNYLPHPGKISRRFNELQVRINKRLTKEGKDNVPKIRLHDLRHSFISILINGGEVNPYQISAAAGHVIETVIPDNTTTRRYWHDQGDRQQIIEYLDKNITVDFTNYINKKNNA
ncbi:MAG: xerC3 [Anaerocolumna sp.]|jgi:integrase|nr:xerC3 [Anaerocolumna sp.]